MDAVSIGIERGVFPPLEAGVPPDWSLVRNLDSLTLLDHLQALSIEWFQPLFSTCRCDAAGQWRHQQKHERDCHRPAIHQSTPTTVLLQSHL